MIDFDAMSGVAGVAAGAFEVPCAGDEAAAAACSGSAVRGFSGMAATVVATGDAGRGRAGALRDRLSFRRRGRCGSRLRRCRRRILPRDCAGHRIQPLFQNGDAGVQPVPIAVEGIDRGRQPPRFVLVFFGERPGFAAIAAARSAAATCSRRHPIEDWLASRRHDDNADGSGAPRSQPPQRAPVDLVLLGQKSGQQAAGIFSLEAASQMVGIFFPYELSGAPEACRITQQTLTGMRA